MYNNDEFAEERKEIPEINLKKNRLLSYVFYLIAGILFGFLLTKSEVISWYRIQEMFWLKSFHMYGVIGSAVLTGILSLQVLRRLKIRTRDGNPITFPVKQFQKGQIIGGLLFGFGWAMTGACPGPLFILIGTGATPIVIALLSAIGGTWVYGYFQDKLPH
jgi:uncharacterized membrane protein YedE/YeeE